MDETTRRARELNALENTAADLERLRVLKEHGLGVHPEYHADGGSYVPETFAAPLVDCGLPVTTTVGVISPEYAGREMPAHLGA